MLILRCRNCLSTFKLKEKTVCPICGEILDAKSVAAIQNILNQIDQTVRVIQDLGWDLFVSSDNTFIHTLNYPDGTVSIPYRLLVKE